MTSAPPASFLLLHGFQHFRPASHWLHWLADRLDERGRTVAYPQLPTPDHPVRDRWIEALHTTLDKLPDPVVVIGHSLGAWLWLNAVRGVDRDIQRVLLVSPPSPDTVRLFRDLQGFDLPIDDALAEQVRKYPTEFVAGDDDPWLTGGIELWFAEPLGLPATVVPGGRHLDLQAGYGSWPSMLQWSLASEGPITGR